MKTSGVAGALQGALPVLKNVFPSPLALKQVAFHCVLDENPSVSFPDFGAENVPAYLRDLAGLSVDP